MKTNKLLKKATGVALATVLSVGTFSNVFATALTPINDNAEVVDYSDVPGGVTKTFLVKDDVPMPTETFTFTITGTTAGPKKDNLKAAPASMVKFTNGNTVEFGTDGKTSKELALEYDLNDITEAGIYRVEIKEIAGKRKGLTYDTKLRYMDMHVVRRNGELDIKNVVIYNENGEKLWGNSTVPGGDNISFINRYFIKDDENNTPKDPVKLPDPKNPEEPNKNPDNTPNPNNPNPTQDPDPKNPPTKYDPDQEIEVEVGKKLSLNNAVLDKTQEFKFDITVLGGTSGEKYNIYSGETLVTTLESGTAGTVTLKDGERVRITGLTQEDKITVKEQLVTGYTATNEVTGVYVGNLVTDIIVVNSTKDIVPTGIIENIAPFALIIAVAGGFAYFYFNRNKEEQFA